MTEYPGNNSAKKRTGLTQARVNISSSNEFPGAWELLGNKGQVPHCTLVSSAFASLGSSFHGVPGIFA